MNLAVKEMPQYQAVLDSVLIDLIETWSLDVCGFHPLKLRPVKVPFLSV